jgi:hypothetical protein
MAQKMQPSRTYDWVLKPEEAAVVRRVVDEVMLPGSEKIRQIAATGAIPVVVFEPMGGMDEVFGPHGTIIPLSSAKKRGLMQFPETKAWFRKELPRGMVKVFAIVHIGSFCLNWVSGHELYVEPGTLDAEWKS